MFQCRPGNPGPTGRRHRVGDQVSQMNFGTGTGGNYDSLLGMKGALAEDRQGF